MHRIIPRSERIQRLVSRGHPRITYEARPRIFHRIYPMISSSLQSPLPHECTKIGQTQTAVAGINRERVYSTQCVPLGSTDFVRKEEGWYDVYVH